MSGLNDLVCNQQMDDFRSILFVDAYDSFSQNIKALLHQTLSTTVTTIQIDTNVEKEFGCGLDKFLNNFSAIVLGPGPGDPRHESDDIGIFGDVLTQATSSNIPVLGICLGFQSICLKYGYSIQRMPEPCHGHAKQIKPQTSHPLFHNIDLEGIYATCYNSLGAPLPESHQSSDVSRPGSSSTNASFGSTSESAGSLDSTPVDTGNLEVLAVDEYGYIMAVAHRLLPQYGLQFHPESCKSNHSCQRLLVNWFDLVQKHNKNTRWQRRTNPKGRHHGTGSSCVRDGVSRSKSDQPSSCESKADCQNLLELLKAATTSSGPRVCYRQRQTNLTRKEISEAIMDLQRGSEIVMLESTRKGRFSIYALLEPDLQYAGLTAQKKKLSGMSLRAGDGIVSFRCSRSLRMGLESQGIEAKYPERNDTAGTLSRLRLDNGDLLEVIQDLVIQKHATGGPADIPFWGGFSGFMSYEMGLDQLGLENDKALGRSVEDLHLLWIERSLVFDAQTSTVTIQSIIDGDEAFIDHTFQHLDKWSQRSMSIRNSQRATALSLQRALKNAQFQMPVQEEYNRNYDNCQKHLRQGNSYELCLTTEARISLPALDNDTVFLLYQNMHAHNPVPYGAFLDLPNLTILSTSPEEFMAWDRSGTINMRPMKGTVKRSPKMTLAKAREILSTPKESAENLMIADLIRHDLYAAVGYTSRVEVIKLCEVIEHETVYQLVSHIQASAPIPRSIPHSSQQQLAMHYGFKALTTSLPPGSMTGAPKKRSCEILRGLENRNRGVYSGVIGYLDVGGGGAWNVCIRTAFRVKNDDDAKNIWRVGAGGAITVLSTRQGEWEEMQTKLNSVLKGFTTVKEGTF